MKRLSIVLAFISLLLIGLTFGCIGGNYPEKITLSKVEPDCLKVISGSVPGRLAIMNNCSKDIMITNISSDSKSGNYSAYFCIDDGKCGWFEINSNNTACLYTNLAYIPEIEGKGRLSEDYNCSNLLIVSYEKAYLNIDGFEGNFELSSNESLIQGKFEGY